MFKDALDLLPSVRILLEQRSTFLWCAWNIVEDTRRIFAHLAGIVEDPG